MVTSSQSIAIIGAGPSGLMAAETLATAGYAVTVYDRMPTPARKLLIAGHGGLNLTHSEPLDRFLKRYGSATRWLTPSLRSFGADALRDWCEGLGEETFIGTSGRVFPRKMKAVSLLRAWLKRLESLHVQYRPRHRWHGWQGNALHFTDATGAPYLVEHPCILLALGGASWKRLGSDGAWTDILAQYGIGISPLRPANCGFLVPWSEHFLKHAGSPLKPVSITHDGITRQGEAMVTRQGLEGGVVYALSSRLRESIVLEGKAKVTLDLRPGMPVEALAKKLDIPRGSKSFSTYLRKAGLSPVTIGLLRETVPPQQLQNATSAELAHLLKALPLTFTGTAGIERAISSAGGITRESVTEDFMLHAIPGVFVAGEMLDWEAPTGGYLLQACFSTAIAAARGIDRYCRH